MVRSVAMVPGLIDSYDFGTAYDELFVSGGLGYVLQIGRDLNDMPLVLAVMGVIVAVGIAFDRIIFAPMESWVRTRWGLNAP